MRYFLVALALPWALVGCDARPYLKRFTVQRCQYQSFARGPDMDFDFLYSCKAKDAHGGELAFTSRRRVGPGEMVCAREYPGMSLIESCK